MSMEPTKRARLASLALLLAVLLSGFLLGLAWDRTLVATAPSEGDEPAAAEHERDDRDGGDDERRRRGLIVERVGLSPEQKIEVDSIVAYHRQRMDDLEKEVAPRFRALVEETRASIKDVLTDDQRAQYDSLLAEHDRKRRDRRRSSDDSNER